MLLALLQWVSPNIKDAFAVLAVGKQLCSESFLIGKQAW